MTSPAQHHDGGSVAAASWSAPENPEAVRAALERFGYLADEGLATAIFLALVLERPLFLEGEPGVGKTEVANVIAAWTGSKLVRLQCYDGIDIGQAVYEWDYSRQLLHLRAAELRGERYDVAAVEDELFSERFLVRRPLMQAIAPNDDEGAPPPVLLVDELDRADDEFEAYLLEVLADYAITIPELGTFRASKPPIVILTSNRTRDVHDALKRRALYHWVEHPDLDREIAIVRLRAPEVSMELAAQVAAAVQALRGMDLYKAPGVSETIDWARALETLGRTTLDAHVIAQTLGTVLKYREDLEQVDSARLAELAEVAASHR